MPDEITSLRAALSDRYVIEREVGRGGMATVYLARDVKHDRRVAIKVLHPEFSESATAERFLREIRIAASLRHPGILPVYDSGEVGGLLYYVMPYVPGESLRERLEREKQLPVEEALRITSELAAALEEAHGRGIVHRDVKPENVLFEGEQPQLMDFGVARAAPEAGSEKLTRTGVSVGTPHYMSPEQASGEAVDARSDVYALGCVLYEMLGGEPPYTGPTSQAIMARHAMAPVPDVRTLRPTVAEGVVAALERALAKVPADRYEGAEAFAEALERGDEKLRRREARGLNAPRWLAWGLAVVVVAGLLGLGVFRTLRSAVPAEAAAMAVLPLAPALEGDTALARLGRQVAQLVAYNLMGVGGIETESPIAMLAAVGDDVLEPEEATRLAAEFGSSSVVTGSVVPAGYANAVRADVVLLTTEGRFLAQTSATASVDSVTVLADALTAKLLGEIWRKGESPTPQVQAALGTDSLKALRKFLEGEMAYARFSPPEAVEKYEEAFRIDSTFWLAAAMYAVSYNWVRDFAQDMPEHDPEFLAVLRDHADELPDPQRSWIRAAPWRFGLSPTEFEPDASWFELFATYASLAADNWDFWPILTDFGDAVLHTGPLYGQPLEQAREAFAQAIDLNPDIGQNDIWAGHLWLAEGEALEGEWELETMAAALPDGSWRDSIRAARGWHLGTLCESFALEPADPDFADTLRAALLEDAEHRLRNAQDEGQRLWIFPYVQRFPVAADYGTPRCLVDFFANGLSIDLAPRDRAWFEVAIATGWAGRGAWDSAWAHIRGAANGADPSATLAAYRIAVAGAWLGYLETEAVRGLREAHDRAIHQTTHEPLPGPRFVSEVESRLDPGEPHLRAEQAWLDGLLAVADGDRVALRDALAAIPAEADWVTNRFRRSLGAFELLLAGDTAAAIDSLWALEAKPVAGEDPFLWTGAIGEELSVLRPINRLALSRWLFAKGDPTRAEGLLYWHEAVHPPLMKVSLFAEGLASLELGRIHEAMGRPETARKYYRKFLRTDPIDDYAELGEEAREAVARLDLALAEQVTSGTGAPDA